MDKIKALEAKIQQQTELLKKTERLIVQLKAEKFSLETGINVGDIVIHTDGYKMIIKAVESWKFLASRQNKNGSWSKTQEHLFLSNITK